MLAWGQLKDTIALCLVEAIPHLCLYLGMPAVLPGFYTYWVLEKSDSNFIEQPPVNPLLTPHLLRCFYIERPGKVSEYFSSRILGKEDCFLRYYNWFLHELYFLWLIRPGCAVRHHCSLEYASSCLLFHIIFLEMALKLPIIIIFLL